MTPIHVVEQIIDGISLDDFEEVQFATWMLFEAYTCARTESSLPKTFDGFDGEFHWQNCDVDLRIVNGQRFVALRMKGTKPDPRRERPEAAGNDDWSYLGEIPGSKWCPVLWLTRLLAFHGARDTAAPFFLARDRVRPYTYGCGASDFKVHQQGVGVVEENLTGPHGLRVLGWNRIKDSLGAGLAQAHGGWRSKSGCRRYDRFSMGQVYNIPAAIADVFHDDTRGGVSAPSSSDDDERPIPQGNLARDARAARANRSGSSRDHRSSSPLAPLLPPGWVRVQRHTSTGRQYAVYKSPTGGQVASRVAAWRSYDADGSGKDSAYDEDDSDLHLQVNDEALVAAETLGDLGGTSSNRGWHYRDDEEVALIASSCATVGCTFPRGHSGVCSNWLPSSERRRR